MTLPAILLAASAQIYGTDIPDHFRDANVSAYVRCLRTELNDANEPWSADPAAPTVVQFGQLITYCGPERSRAAFSLRGFIQARHSDWSPGRVARSAEFVLSGMELQKMADARRPDISTHDYPPDEY